MKRALFLLALASCSLMNEGSLEKDVPKSVEKAEEPSDRERMLRLLKADGEGKQPDGSDVNCFHADDVAMRRAMIESYVIGEQHLRLEREITPSESDKKAGFRVELANSKGVTCTSLLNVLSDEPKIGLAPKDEDLELMMKFPGGMMPAFGFFSALEAQRRLGGIGTSGFDAEGRQLNCGTKIGTSTTQRIFDFQRVYWEENDPFQKAVSRPDQTVRFAAQAIDASEASTICGKVAMTYGSNKRLSRK